MYLFIFKLLSYLMVKNISDQLKSFKSIKVTRFYNLCICILKCS